MNTPQDTYNKRIVKYSQREKLLKKRDRTISNVRLLIALCTLIGVSIGFYTLRWEILFPSLLSGILVFTLLMKIHDSVSNSIKHLSLLTKINNDSLAVFSNEWKNNSFSGEEYINHDHQYSTDLDIFGHGSLFQKYNRAKTFFGVRCTVNSLIHNNFSIEEIKQRQDAIKELSKDISFRQRIEMLALKYPTLNHNPEQFVLWSKASHGNTLSETFIKLARILPLVAITIALFSKFMVGTFLYSVPVYIVLYFIARMYSVATKETFDQLTSLVKTLEAYKKISHLIERKKFTASYLLNLQNSLDEKNKKASQEFQKLESVVNRSEIRFNSVIHFFLNTMFLWDIHCLYTIEKWHKKNSKSVKKWLNSIGRFEEVASFGSIPYNYPQWTFPTLYGEGTVINGEKVGHPLLSEETRVGNDFPLMSQGQCMILTGSNMSGKSTYLRSVGINLILAYCGTPVCAQSFECSLVDVYSSMRIRDNLLENVSSFFAELLRIKKIVEKSNDGGNVFYLIDEIFRGTNSRDRITGAEIILRQLSKTKALGMVSTHDLELCKLADDNIRCFQNYHFSESIEENMVNFDYLLKKGPSNSSNALALIRLVGIDITS